MTQMVPWRKKKGRRGVPVEDGGPQKAVGVIPQTTLLQQPLLQALNANSAEPVEQEPMEEKEPDCTCRQAEGLDEPKGAMEEEEKEKRDHIDGEDGRRM